VIYAHKITAEDQRIDWSRPAAEVDCHIRGLSPFPGAWFLYEPEGEEPLRMKALMSVVEASPKSDASAGTVLDDALLIACGDGKAVRLLRAQKPGSKAMDAEMLLRGLPIAAGEMLT
jgi:methionyl-tRNA formyltransferase